MTGLGCEVWTVDAVAHERVADMCKMHPNLMGAPGFELARHQRRDRFAVPAAEAFLELPMGDRLTAVLAHRHFLPGMRMPVDRRVHRATMPVGNAPDKGHVAASHFAGAAMISKLRAQRLMSRVVLRYHHQPGGVLVE